MKKEVEPIGGVLAPGPDWVPLARAPFYYSRRGFLATSAEREAHLRSLVARHERDSGVDWSLRTTAIESMAVKALGLTLEVSPSTNDFSLSDADDELGLGRDITVIAAPDRFIDAVDDLEVEPRWVSAVAWHRKLANHLLNSLHDALTAAIESGAAHIMARRNTVLAPFERVHPDQWAHFRLDEPEVDTLPHRWFFPELASRRLDEMVFPATASGPRAEKLFSIHMAPGATVSTKAQQRLGPEEECAIWLIGMMEKNPDAAPKPLAELKKESCRRFKSLSGKAFERAYKMAVRQTHNAEWSRPGRRSRKSPQRIPSEK